MTIEGKEGVAKFEKRLQDGMGFGLFAHDVPKGYRFKYTKYEKDEDNLRPAASISPDDDYTIMFNSVSDPNNIPCMLSPPKEMRGYGCLPNAVDYTLDSEGKLKHLSESDRKLVPNALMVRDDGNVFLETTQHIVNDFVMVVYGASYTNEKRPLTNSSFFEQFVTHHRAQFIARGIPQALWQGISDQFENEHA